MPVTCLPRHQSSPLRPLQVPPVARPAPSHLQLLCLPCDVTVRVATLRSQRWRALALTRLVRFALDLPLHAASHALRAPSQMLRAACRSVVYSVSCAPPVAVRQRARLVGKRRRCPPVVALTHPRAFC
jgi:hypothetical protein